MKWFAVAILIAIAAFAVLFGSAGSVEHADFRMIVPGDQDTLDPQRMSWMKDIRTADLLFEGLLQIAPVGEGLRPGVATNIPTTQPDLSADALTYTYHLRPDAKWSNGDPVTAEDYIYAWTRALIPDSAADYTELFYCIAGAEDFYNWRDAQFKEFTKTIDDRRAAGKPMNDQEARDFAAKLWADAESHFKETVGLVAPDDHTLVVKLARPTLYFNELVAYAPFYPVSRKSTEKVVDGVPLVRFDPATGFRIQDARWTQPEHFIGNGPYTIKTWRFRRDLLMVQNPFYWNKAAMKNTSILQIVMTEPALQVLALERGEADWLPEIPTAGTLAADLLAAQKRHERNDVHTGPAAGTYFYNFNCQEKLSDGVTPNPLRDPRVRRALSMAVDRKVIVEKVTRVFQPVAYTLTPPGSCPGYDAPVEAGMKYDPVAAKKLLAEAGYPDGSKLTGLSILVNTEGEHTAIALYLRSAWLDNLGVSTEIEALETRGFRERKKKKDYTISRGSWYGDYKDPTTWLDLCKSTNGNNDSGYNSPEYDALLKQASETTDAATRLNLLRKAEAIMLDDQPIMPLYQYTNLYMYDANHVTGLDPNPWNRLRLELVSVKR